MDQPAGDVFGAAELARVLMTTRACVKEHELWRVESDVYELPPVEGVDTSFYDTLMSSVPDERASVPVLMHAMLEQVRQAPPRDHCMVLKIMKEVLVFTNKCVAAKLY